MKRMSDFGQLLDGNYKVVREIGEGGFGRVLLAEDIAIPNRFVAIKVLIDQDQERQEILLDEMAFLSNLQNPFIVTFHHHFQNNGRLHLVMEYCTGGSLRNRINHGSGLEPNLAFQWGIHLADVFDFVHDKNIIHHDIKPDNLLFSREGHLKVGDFGVANRNIGTNLYMAPELFTERDISIRDRRIDIYALGITLFELIRGNNPFFYLAPNERLLAKLRGDFISPDLPRWVQEILLKATHTTPELRFQTMTEFREAMVSKTVPLVVDRRRMDAHKQSIAAETRIGARKWIRAEKIIRRALEGCPDSVPANITAGKLYIRMKQIDKAKAHLDQALRLNPRVNIQKELGWVNLEMGKTSIALSLLNDHLQRNPLDEEAQNLLLQCYYETGRYELGADLAGQNLLNADCFLNNYFLCRVLSGEAPEDIVEEKNLRKSSNAFIHYNLAVIEEYPKSWDDEGGIPLKSKLLFQDYRFSQKKRSLRTNTMSIAILGKDQQELSQTIITIGRTPDNVLHTPDPLVSRRHCVIINYPDDVWIYDLASTNGTFINGERIYGKAFLLGVCELTIGGYGLHVTSTAGLLV
jgi:hypothetical protein